MSNLPIPPSDPRVDQAKAAFQEKAGAVKGLETKAVQLASRVEGLKGELGKQVEQQPASKLQQKVITHFQKAQTKQGEKAQVLGKRVSDFKAKAKKADSRVAQLSVKVERYSASRRIEKQTKTLSSVQAKVEKAKGKLPEKIEGAFKAAESNRTAATKIVGFLGEVAAKKEAIQQKIREIDTEKGKFDGKTRDALHNARNELGEKLGELTKLEYKYSQEGTFEDLAKQVEQGAEKTGLDVDHESYERLGEDIGKAEGKLAETLQGAQPKRGSLEVLRSRASSFAQKAFRGSRTVAPSEADFGRVEKEAQAEVERLQGLASPRNISPKAQEFARDLVDRAQDLAANIEIEPSSAQDFLDSYTDFYEGIQKEGLSTEDKQLLEQTYIDLAAQLEGIKLEQELKTETAEASPYQGTPSAEESPYGALPASGPETPPVSEESPYAGLPSSQGATEVPLPPETSPYQGIPPEETALSSSESQKATPPAPEVEGYEGIPESAGQPEAKEPPVKNPLLARYEQEIGKIRVGIERVKGLKKNERAAEKLRTSTSITELEARVGRRASDKAIKKELKAEFSKLQKELRALHSELFKI